MTVDEFNKIPEEEWGKAALRLLHSFSKRIDESVCLPKGNSLEGVINGAIADLISGKRKYYPENDLCCNLKWIVKSNLNKIFKYSDNTKRVDLIDDDGHNYVETVEEDFYELPILDESSLIQELQKEIEDDDDLMLMFISIVDDGFSKPSEIAENTGIKVDRVYELKRKLGDRIKKVQRKILQMEIQVVK